MTTDPANKKNQEKQNNIKHKVVVNGYPLPATACGFLNWPTRRALAHSLRGPADKQIGKKFTTKL